MVQDNFDSLVIAKESDDSMLDRFSPVNPTNSEEKPEIEVDGYVPVNDISEEVMAMIKEWELQRYETTEVSSTDAPLLVDYEPMRTCSKTTPPKRFFLSFWRSVTRRLLKGDKQAVIASTRRAAESHCSRT